MGSCRFYPSVVLRTYSHRWTCFWGTKYNSFYSICFACQDISRCSCLAGGRAQIGKYFHLPHLYVLDVAISEIICADSPHYSLITRSFSGNKPRLIRIYRCGVQPSLADPIHFIEIIPISIRYNTIAQLLALRPILLCWRTNILCKRNIAISSIVPRLPSNMQTLQKPRGRTKTRSAADSILAER